MTAKLLFFGVFVIIIGWSAGKKPPLLEDRAPRKPHHSSSECIFGKEHKEIGSTWFADLGPPFGIMHCIKCQCNGVQKKRRVVGRVECQNIGKDCPEVKCDDPIQIPGRCCKICRNDTDLVEIQHDVSSNVVEDEETSTKHYAAVLTIHGHHVYSSTWEKSMDEITPYSSASSTNQAATGRFMLHKRNLYYSFYASSRPDSIQFINMFGNILEEQVIPDGSVYQNATEKICGVWHLLSREYRRLLREGKLLVSLMWKDSGKVISGALMRYRPLATETFSSLLLPQSLTSDGVAGTAVVTISTVTPSVHIMTLISGFTSSGSGAESFVIKLQSIDTDAIILEEIVKVEKSTSELTVMELRAGVQSVDLHSLIQQRLKFSITSRNTPMKIEGIIRGRVYCELFQAPLAAPTADSSKHLYRKSRASGLTWMYVDGKGSLTFNVNIEDLDEPVNIELVSTRHLTLVEDLTKSGTTNGSIYLSPKHLEQLYNEELSVNVAPLDSRETSLIKGRLVSRPVADSRDSSRPQLLKRRDVNRINDVMGIAWANIDNECNLHYDVSLYGANLEDRHLELYLEDIPLLAVNAPITRRLLDEFSGTSVEDYKFDLSSAELMRIDSGIAFLDVWDTEKGISLLKAQWEKVMLPLSCINSAAENNNGIMSLIPLHDDSERVELPTKCLHDARFYELGDQWKSTLDECTMCSCNAQASVKCDPVPCPKLNCTKKAHSPGECCPVCDESPSVLADNSQKPGCTLGGQTFSAGSSWHPYIPPIGFETCIVCDCNAQTLQVQCRRSDCPVLDCDEKVAYRINKKDCCKVCPMKKTGTSSIDNVLGDQLNKAKYERDILAAGGCKFPSGGPYENGKEWNPRLESHGIIHCVICKCKDGIVKCERKKCAKWSCGDPCCSGKTKCAKTKEIIST